MGSRGSSMYHSSGKRWPYSTLLLLAFGAAMLSVLVVHKLRESRVLGLLLHDRESQLYALQLIIEKERVHSRVTKAKIEELKARAASLKTQKVQLNTRLMEAENMVAYHRNKRTELEQALEKMQKRLATKRTSVMENREAVIDLKQRQGHVAEEMGSHLQQTSNEQMGTSLVHEASSKRDESDPNMSKEEDAAGVDDVAKAMENGEQGQGSKRGGTGWVRIETNADGREQVGDGVGQIAEEEEHGKVETSGGGTKQSEGAVQVSNQDTGEVKDVNQFIGRTALLQTNTTTVDREHIENEVEAASTNSTVENVVAFKDVKPEGQKDDNADGDKLQAEEDTQTERSRHDDVTDERQTDRRPVDENGTELNSVAAELKMPEHQSASTQTQAAGEQSQVTAVNLGVSVGSDGDDEENSETKLANTESYQDTNWTEEKTNGNDSGDQLTVSDSSETNTSEDVTLPKLGGHENEKVSNIRSTMEAGEQSVASRVGQTEEDRSGEEGEISAKDQGSGQSEGEQQQGEKIEGGENQTSTGAKGFIQEEENDTGNAEDEARR